MEMQMWFGMKNIGSRNISRKPITSLIFGIVIGFCVAVLIVSSTSNPLGRKELELQEPLQARNSSDMALFKDIGSHNMNEDAHAMENHSISNKLYDEVKVLCWIMTNPDNHHTKARHVINTWGRHCNKLLIMSSKEDPEVNSIALPVDEGRNNLWAKTKEAFKYIYNHHFNEADWFFKADDDTYAIVENLRYMLYPYESEAPIYFGYKFKNIVKQGYMSGGAGYVLSKEAVRRFVVDAIPNATLCRGDNSGAEDAEIGKCLENVNVTAGDSRDPEGRGRFFALKPVDHLLADITDREYWYWKNQYYKTDEGLNCCSDNAITFHYIPPDEMYVLEYLIYHLRPYGVVPHAQILPEKISIDDIKSTVVTTTIPTPPGRKFIVKIDNITKHANLLKKGQ